MTSVWERFNEIEGADSNAVVEATSQYEPFEEGDYKVRLEGLEASESKSGLPMAKGKFRVIEGERENNIIFYNQVIQNLNYPNITALNISKVMALVSGILGERIEYTGLADLERLLSEIEEGIEFTLSVTYDKKDTEKAFPQLRVTEDIDDLELKADGEDEEF